MALSNAIDQKTGTSQQPPKIIPHPSENCISPDNCQYWLVFDRKCSLQECPFKRPREMVGVALTEEQNKDMMQEVTQTKRSCCICGATFIGFIGAVPICNTCMDRVRDVIVNPHCPGCGTTVSSPHMLCSSCKQAYLRSGD